MFCKAHAVNQVVTEAPSYKKQRKKQNFFEIFDQKFTIFDHFFRKIFEISLSPKTEIF